MSKESGPEECLSCQRSFYLAGPAGPGPLSVSLNGFSSNEKPFGILKSNTFLSIFLFTRGLSSFISYMSPSVVTATIFAGYCDFLSIQTSIAV